MDDRHPPASDTNGLRARVSRRVALRRLGGRGAAAAALAAAGYGPARALAQANDASGDAMIPAATRGSLPMPAPADAGLVRRLTDDDRGVWLDTGQQWYSLTREVFDVRAFGASGDGKTDDWGAFAAAIEAMAGPPATTTGSPAGRTLFVPPGRYRLAQSLILNRAVRLVGANTGAPADDTILLFDTGIVGIVVAAANPELTGQPGRSGEGALIERLRLQAASGFTATSAHGIWLQTRASVRDCTIAGFGGDGIHVELPPGLASADASGWEVGNCRVAQCGGHGLQARGDGVSGGLCARLTATGNGGWGIADTSATGNAYVQCTAQGNGRGPFTTNGDANHTLVLGGVAAGDQPPSIFSSGTLVVGGDNGPGFAGGNAWTATASRMDLIGQAPGSGSSSPAAAPTLHLVAGDGQTEPHLRVATSGGTQQAALDVAGRLVLGAFDPGATGGSPDSQALPLQLGGGAGLRWVVQGPLSGWVGQARALVDLVPPGVKPTFADTRLTLQTPDESGAEIDTLTLRQGRVGVGTTVPSAAAILDLTATGQGFLPPRLTTAQRNAIASPPEGLVVYNLTSHRLNLYDGTAWRELPPAPGGA